MGELIFDIIDTYQGLEKDDSTIKAGTEELDFFSWTGAYNRDNKPCINFTLNEFFDIIKVINSKE